MYQSMNGTWVNGERLKNCEITLKEGDQIGIGHWEPVDKCGDRPNHRQYRVVDLSDTVSHAQLLRYPAETPWYMEYRSLRRPVLQDPNVGSSADPAPSGGENSDDSDDSYM